MARENLMRQDCPIHAVLFFSSETKAICIPVSPGSPSSSDHLCSLAFVYTGPQAQIFLPSLSTQILPYWYLRAHLFRQLSPAPLPASLPPTPPCVLLPRAPLESVSSPWPFRERGPCSSSASSFPSAALTHLTLGTLLACTLPSGHLLLFISLDLSEVKVFNKKLTPHFCLKTLSSLGFYDTKLSCFSPL